MRERTEQQQVKAKEEEKQKQQQKNKALSRRQWHTKSEEWGREKERSEEYGASGAAVNVDAALKYFYIALTHTRKF